MPLGDNAVATILTLHCEETAEYTYTLLNLNISSQVKGRNVVIFVWFLSL